MNLFKGESKSLPNKSKDPAPVSFVNGGQVDESQASLATTNSYNSISLVFHLCPNFIAVWLLYSIGNTVYYYMHDFLWSWKIWLELQRPINDLKLVSKNVRNYPSFNHYNNFYSYHAYRLKYPFKESCNWDLTPELNIATWRNHVI